MEFKQLVITRRYLGFSDGEIKPCRLWLESYNSVCPIWAASSVL